MELWVRSRVFLDGERYRNEYAKLNTFIRSYADDRLLFLELGVKRMMPLFIRQPF